MIVDAVGVLTLPVCRLVSVRGTCLSPVTHNLEQRERVGARIAQMAQLYACGGQVNPTIIEYSSFSSWAEVKNKFPELMANKDPGVAARL